MAPAVRSRLRIVDSWRAHVLCLALACLLAAASAVRANDRSLAGVGATLPRSADLVIAIRNASTQRQSPAGVSAAAMLMAFSDFDGTAGAWRELSDRLELDPASAFDELLGRRVLLIAKDFDDPERRQWAVITEITARTELSLRLRLKPAPRSVQNGLPILALEQGRIELVTAPFEQGSIALMAPSSSRELLEQLLPTIRRQPRTDPLSADPVFAALAPTTDADIALFVRTSASEGVTLAATARPGGWDAKVAATPTLVGQWLSLPAGSDRPLFPPVDVIDDGAMLAVAGRSPTLLRLLLGSLMDGVFEAESPSLVAATRNRGTGRPSLIIAQPVDPSISTTAIDRTIADRLAPTKASGSLFSPPRSDAPPTLAGLYPGTVRLQRVDPDQLGPLSVAFGEKPRLAWLHQQGPRPWLIGRLNGIGDEATLSLLANQLDRRRIERDDRLPATAGWIRPRELFAIVPTGTIPPALMPFERVKRFGWSMIAEPDQPVRGTVRLDLMTDHTTDRQINPETP